MERSLDDFPEPFSRHFAISLSAAMPVAVDDQHALTRKPGTQASDQAGLGIRIEALGLPKIPTKRDAGARSVDVLATWAARAARQLHDLGAWNSVAPGKR
jgi:hypothetical protein